MLNSHSQSEGGQRAYPLLPLRNLVLFPGQVLPLLVGREKSMRAIHAAEADTKELLLVAQRDGSALDPDPETLQELGTIGVLLQVLRLPDGTMKILVEGRQRARVIEFVETDDVFMAKAEAVLDMGGDSTEIEPLMRSVKEAFEVFQKLQRSVPPDVMTSMDPVTDPSRLSDMVSTRMGLKVEDQQALLEELDVKARLDQILKFIQAESEILQVERKIKTRVKKQVERNQKEYYLNERMQAIQKELGDKDEFRNEMQELEDRIRAKDLPDEVRDKIERELRKLKMMSPMSAESAVVRNYIDWVLALPWHDLTDDQEDLVRAGEILDEDHYGLKKPKERILEYLAVSTLVEEMKGPILCLVGPPGVGKTSLARSIARATGRTLVRQALGGVRDEAEIRGHRRTYIGALPGKIIQCIRRAGTANPVFLLDEVDKMSMDFRGDPSAALLEVLDPEQNHTFNDHYLELDFDLSKVMFICTANTVQGVPPALVDRLEIIHISGYTEWEKLSIARRFLYPKLLEANGLEPRHLRFSRDAILAIIRGYTREAGVRNLEREMSAVCRKVARRVVERGPETRLHLTEGKVQKLLGVPRFQPPAVEASDETGLVKGLAVTHWGGEMIEVEVAVIPGTGKLILTGLLGDWLKESATAAFSYIRSRARLLGLAPDFKEKHDFHIHYPGSAVKTDGPSAGITMATALVSALTGIPARKDVAMTGEITLRGRVLPIGGLKDKALAAHRGEMARVIIPSRNEKDIKDIPARIRDELEIVTVSHMDEVLQLALALDDPESLFSRDPDRSSSQEPREPTTPPGLPM